METPGRFTADMLRVVFFGNSESVFSNRHFEALLESPCRIVAVVDVPPAKRVSTNPNVTGGARNFVERARAQNSLTFEPASPNAPEFVSALRESDPDVFIAVGYMNLLKAEVLAVPRLLAANFHASLLPAYRGKHPVFWALRNGEKWVGLTVHVMDAHFDTGDILFQVRVRTRKRDSVGTLYDRIMDASVPLVARLIADTESGRLVHAPQTNTGSSYYSSTQEQDFRLDWSHDAEQLRRWIQTSPGQCFTGSAGHRVFVAEAERVAYFGRAAPGALLNIGRTTVTIRAGKDALCVKRARLTEGDEKSAAQLFGELGLKLGNRLE